MSRTRQASRERQPNTLKGKVLADAVVFHLRMSAGYALAMKLQLSKAHEEKAMALFRDLSPERKGVVNMIRPHLRPFGEGEGERCPDVFVEYEQSPRPGADAAFVSVGLTKREKDAFKEFAATQPEGNMACVAARLIRRELASNGYRVAS